LIELRELSCPHCGAPLRLPPEGTSSFTCPYCEKVSAICDAPARNDADMLRLFDDPKPAPRRAPPEESDERPSSTEQAEGTRVFLIAGAVVLAGVVTFLVLNRSAKTSAKKPAFAPTVAAAPVRKPPPVPVGPSNVMWMDQYALPVAVDANGDGVEDIAGPVVFVEDKVNRAYVAVFDGKDLRLLWRAGPYGTRETASYHKLSVATSGKGVVVVDPKGNADLFDVRSGKLIAHFTDSKPLGAMCGSPGDSGSGHIFIEWDGLYQHEGVLVDVDAGTFTKGYAPEWCFERNELFSGKDLGVAPRMKTTMPDLPKLTGNPWLDGDVGVLVASAKGEDETQAVAFDRRTGAIHWQSSASALNEDGGPHLRALALAQGRFWFTDNKSLVSLDAHSGKPTFRAKLLPGGAYVTRMRVTDTRAYAMHTEWDAMPFDVYDLKKEKLVARFAGAWREF
jgi:hypothetical protein